MKRSLVSEYPLERRYVKNMSEKVKDFLFVSFLFFLPFQTVYLLREPMIGEEKWQYGTIGIYISSAVLVFAVMIAATLKTKAFGKKAFGRLIRTMWRKRRSDALLAIFVLWASLSIFWARDHALALYGFLILLVAADALMMARDMVRRGLLDRIVVALLLGAVTQSLIGIWQFLSQDTFSSTFFGMSTHEVWQAGTSVLKNDSGRWLRAYGTFAHPNMFGLYLAGVLLLAFWWIVVSTRLRWLEKSWKRVAFSAMAAVILLGIFVSFSRLAWVGFSMGFSVLFSEWIRRRRTTDPVTRKYVWAFFGTVLISGAVFSFLLRETTFPRFDGSTVDREGSVTDRMTTYRDAVRVIRERPLLGSGIWNSTAELISLDPGRSIWNIQPAHDVPLLVVAELGIPGLVLLICFLVSLTSEMIKKRSATATVMFLLFVPSLLFDHFLWDSVSGMLFLTTLLGIASSDD
ncbi:MAG: O-antigen ligase family protein [Candidatus Moranbacteria bacterium]|nr:O-antigen ligase family protein [Candidatus Moranbacteria bacterium]